MAAKNKSTKPAARASSKKRDAQRTAHPSARVTRLQPSQQSRKDKKPQKSAQGRDYDYDAGDEDYREGPSRGQSTTGRSAAEDEGGGYGGKQSERPRVSSSAGPRRDDADEGDYGSGPARGRENPVTYEDPYREAETSPRR